MEQIVPDKHRLEFSRSATHCQLVLDPILGCALLSSHKETWLDVFTAEVYDSLIALEVHDGSLQDGVCQIVTALFVGVDAST